MDRAYGLKTSKESQQAFEIGKEDPKLRDEYGRSGFGQSCLLARRLVESGGPRDLRTQRSRHSSAHFAISVH